MVSAYFIKYEEFWCGARFKTLQVCDFGVSTIELCPQAISFGIIGHQLRNWEWKFYKRK
jgi:hypothetical protein